MESQKILILNEKLEEIRKEKIILLKIKTLINNLYTLVKLTEKNLEDITNEIDSIVPKNFKINIRVGIQPVVRILAIPLMRIRSPHPYYLKHAQFKTKLSLPFTQGFPLSS